MIDTIVFCFPFHVSICENTQTINCINNYLPELCIILEAGQQFRIKNDFLEFHEILVTMVKPWKGSS